MKKLLIRIWEKPAIVIFISLLVYLPLIKGFFIQEDWHLLLEYSSQREYANYVFQQLTNPTSGQYVPVNQVFSYSIFYLFGMNYQAFYVAGLLLHGLAGFMLFTWFVQITKLKIPSLVTAAFFVLAPHHFQATSWVVANIGYSFSVIFMASSFIFFWRWLKEGKLRDGFVSSMFIVLSIFSKDISMFSIVFLPFVTWLLKRKISKVIESMVIVLPALLVEIWHVYWLKVNPNPYLPLDSYPGFVNLITLPVRGIAESIFPQHLIYLLSKGLLFLIPPYSIDKLNTTIFNQQVETSGAAVIVFLVTCMFLYLGRRLFKDMHFQVFLIGGLLTVLSSLSYFFVDTKSFSLLQPRYIYLPIIGICLAFIPVVNYAIKRWSSKAVIVIYLVIIFFAASTWGMSERQGALGEERKYILETIREVIPVNSGNIIIYVESDTSFYGMSDEIKTLPLQYSPPKTVATYLHDKIYIPDKIYDFFFMTELGSQGYVSDSRGSYGFFREFEYLLEVVQENNIDITDVYGFKYQGKAKKIVDTTTQTRELLTKQLH